MIENKGFSRSLSDCLSGVKRQHKTQHVARCAGRRGRAIMADGARRSGRFSAPLVPAFGPSPGWAVELSTEGVDKVVGNRWLPPINPRKTLCLLSLHKKSATLLTMQINPLRTHDSAVTEAVPTLVLRRAAVEFLTRAIAGVSRD